jgi:BlaI family penicillinase repressor
VTIVATGRQGTWPQLSAHLTFALTRVNIAVFMVVIVRGPMRRSPSIPNITEAESAVMEVLWRRSPLPTEAVIAALEGERHWREGTIKALLNRLLTKKAIRAARDGRRFLYSPLVGRDDWLLSESRGLLDRLFAGRIAPLAAHFSRHGRLTKGDIADLKRLISEIDDEE